MGEYVDGRWRPTFGDAHAGVDDAAPDGPITAEATTVSEVPRYEPTWIGSDTVREHPQGEYVAWDDYAALQSKLSACEAERDNYWTNLAAKGPHHGTLIETIRAESAGEIARLTEQLHYANGVADLAMKHRDEAERERDEAVRRLDSIRQLWTGHQSIERLLSGQGRKAYDAMMKMRALLDSDRFRPRCGGNDGE